MRRGLFVLVVLAVLGLAAGATAFLVFGRQHAPILIGLLHSQTGAWATTERSMLDAELLAIEEINSAGGLLGRSVRPIIADGGSDPATYARQARRLIYDDKVSVLIGCCNPEARRAVRPVVEEAEHLLIFPAGFEGLEQSPNIIYPGGPAGQQVVPMVAWCCDTRKARKFFLIGSDSLYAHVASAVLQGALHARQAELVGEVFVGRDSGGGRTAIEAAVTRIEQAAPDVVVNALEGPENAALYARLRRTGITPERVPVVSLFLGEEEVRTLPIADVVGQYAVWNYFQSVDQPENRDFVRGVKAKYGADRVIGDNFQIAYQSVRIWAQTVSEIETDAVEAVNRDMLRQSINGPEGIITIDSDTRSGWRPCYVGKVRPDGQFEIVWGLAKPVRPISYPSSRSREQWDALVDQLQNR